MQVNAVSLLFAYPRELAVSPVRPLQHLSTKNRPKRTLIKGAPRESIAPSVLWKLPQEVQELCDPRSGAGSTFTLNVYPEPFTRRASSEACSPPNFSTANPELWRNGFHVSRAPRRCCRYKN